jgi:hypothetical protein
MFVLTSIMAHAQADLPTSNVIGLYINPAFIRVSNSDTDSGPFAFLGNNTTSRMFYGASIGGYYDFFHGKSFNAGADVRDTIVHGNNASLNSFLLGARVESKPIAFSLKPYAELLGGVGSSKPPTSSVHVSRAAYGVFGGVDYQFSNHVDFRMVEVGYGSVQTVNSGNFGGPVSLPASKLLSISTGLVFHFNAP